MRYGSLPMNCKECRGDEEKRLAWGCDVEIIGPTEYALECWACSGGPCDVCNGEGLIEIRRCPMKTLPLWAGEVCLLSDMMLHGTLPRTGGVLDQDAWTMAAVAIASDARARAQADEMERLECLTGGPN